MQKITIKPWPDPVIDTLGHDPRSRYVETFWLPTLGPTAVLLLRRLADRFDRQPGGFDLPVAMSSRELGLGEREGSASPLLRTVARLVQFGFACEAGGEHWVRRHVPPVSRKHLRRLPAALQNEHQQWLDDALGEPAPQRSQARARRLAFILLEAGDEPDTTERALTRIGFSPEIADTATRWATSRHQLALAAANEQGAA